jgi:DNA-binding MarR family transcriptional regulator
MVARANTSSSDLSPAELDAWRGMLRVHAALTRELDAELAAEHDLPLSSYEVLMTLASEPGGDLRMSELADRVLLSRSGLTRMVDRLARDGLVRRRACPGDARGQLAEITPEGRSVFEHARTTHLDGVRRRFLSQLEPEEMERLAALWQRLEQ